MAVSITKYFWYPGFFLLLLSGFSLSAQTISTVAGSSSIGAYMGDGGAATSARLYSPSGLDLDSDGNLYIADTDNHCVRKVLASTGIITTIAGIGTPGYSGDGSQATSAALHYPSDVVVDASGNVYIADVQNFVVRKVDVSGVITTIAGTGIQGYSGEGVVATSSRLNYPSFITLDHNGILYIVDGQRIRKVAANGTLVTIAGTGTAGYSGDGAAATAAQVNYPGKLHVDATGNVVFPDMLNRRIRMINTAGIIYTIAGTGGTAYAGDGGQATLAQVSPSSGLDIDPDGSIIFSDANRVIRKISSSRIMSRIAGTGANGFSGDGGDPLLALMNSPSGLVVSSSGVVYFSDNVANRVRKVTPCPAPGAPTNTTAASGMTICSGSSTTLSVSGTGTIEWYTAASGGTYLGSGPTYTTPALTSITTYYAQDNTCRPSTRTAIVVTPYTPDVTVSGTTSICSGSQTTLTANGANTYSWSTGSTNQAITVSPTVYTVYTVTGTDLNLCSKTISKAVFIVNPPNVTLSGSNSVCDGSSVTITASGATSYSWSTGESGVSSITVTPTATTTYTVTGTTFCSTTVSKTITFRPLPVVDFVISANELCSDATPLTLSASPSGGVFSGDGVSGNLFTASNAGPGNHSLTYTYTDENLCANSASASILVSACTGVFDSKKELAEVFPNPASDELFIKTTSSVSVKIISVQGTVVLKENLPVGETYINIQKIPYGMYIVEVQESDSIQRIKIIVDK